jgi:ferredoxin
MSNNITIANKNIIYRETHKTLLNCLEAENIEVHYHCRDGFCGACRVKLNKGDIVYPNGEPLAFIGVGEILPCCCIPVNDIDITID